MVALLEGAQAPNLSLISTDGSSYSLYQRLRESPVVLLAFFKTSCPVCHFEFPYLERLHRSFPSVPIWGISQDDADSAVAFSRMFGITFPGLLDEQLSTSVAYGITHVPTTFLIAEDKLIRQTVVGFNKSDLEKLAVELAMVTGVSSKPLFSSADEVPQMRPGCASKQPV